MRLYTLHRACLTPSVGKCQYTTTTATSGKNLLLSKDLGATLGTAGVTVGNGMGSGIGMSSTTMVQPPSPQDFQQLQKSLSQVSFERSPKPRKRIVFKL